ncbi:MAG TPA: gamma-butyrobetaine hydroxylase-like domain-containing protein, partial [Verrucomicrobiae bacterium]|nr:gamma-butyrobetaine hydroxylase-like domain-containing protein [Verrucomicrobiae bacterium]
MQPTNIQQIGDELALKWDDGTESFISLEQLRRHCPCAGCKGEVDIMGN